MNASDSTSASVPSPWHTAGGDPTRRGRCPSAWAVSNQPARRLRASGAVQAAVVFGRDGAAFVADLAGGVRAFASEGRELWSRAAGAGISASPTVHPTQPRLFVGTHTGQVMALNTADGSIAWQRELPTSSDPRILADLLHLPEPDWLVVSSWGGRFYALDAGAGEDRFRWEAGFYPGAAAAADLEGRVYCLRAVAGQGVELIQITPPNEVVVLHREPESPRGARRALVAAAPVVDPDRRRVYAVFNGDRRGRVLAWSLDRKSPAWQSDLEHCVQATPSVAPGGAVVVADLGGLVIALNPDGSRRYRYAGGCDYWLAAPVVDGSGQVLLGDPTGRLHVIDASGAGRVTFEAGRSIQGRAAWDPAGRFYLPCTDGNVYVFAAA